MKRFIALFLIVGLCALLAASCGGPTETEPYYTTHGADTTPPPVVTTERGWDYEKIDLSGGTHKPTSFDENASSIFGYREGTYEYEYFMALSGISYYTMIAKHHLDNESSDAEDGFVSAYLERVDVEQFTAPYASILYHAYTLLSDRDMDLIPVTIQILVEYWQSVPYELTADERATVLALSFNGIDEKLEEYAQALLSLSEKYPDYEGEFTLTEKAVEEAEALIAACRPVAEVRESLRESWRIYYREKEPTLAVKEEFVAAYNAVRVTLSGNGRYYLSNLSGVYIEDYRYEIYTGVDGREHSRALPMDSPVVIYLPVSYYRGTAWSREIDIVKADENERIFYETVRLELDPAEYYSGEPLRMSNEFLDAALRKAFGGDYSERDLLGIQVLRIYQNVTDTLTGRPCDPVIYLGYYAEGTGSEDREMTEKCFYYSEFFEEKSNGLIPEGLEEDLKHFHALKSVQVRQELKDGIYNNPYEFSEGFLESLMPYEVTENTWSNINDQ